MARRTRRRRPRVAWLPTFGGSPSGEGTGASPFTGIEFQLTVDDSVPNGDIVWDAAPLTFDVSEAATEAQASPDGRTLRDIIQGNEWRLRRIVGKAFLAALTETVGTKFPTIADVALGFIVCKTYDDGAPLTDFNEVNPLAQNSMEDPWIWRRRWILAPGGFVAAETALVSNIYASPQFWGYPQNTANYHSVADGPHIDAKSNRRIHRSERLFCVLAARKYNPQDQDSLNVADFRIQGLIDYRLLGSIGAAQYGNRGNMSR